MSERRLHYTFGPLERRGFLGPLRAGQAGLLAAGTLLAIVVLDRSPSVAGVVLATVLIGITVGLALAPLGRRTCEEWAAVVWAYAVRWAHSRLRFRSAIPTLGVGASAFGRTRRLPVAPPQALRGVKILEAGTQERPIGALSERSDRLLTTVLACRVVAFSLLDAEAQERRLSRWGLVLSGAAGSAIRRIQWLERTAPAQGDELARWLHAERDPAVPLRGAPMIESYLELIGATAPAGAAGLTVIAPAPSWGKEVVHGAHSLPVERRFRGYRRGRFVGLVPPPRSAYDDVLGHVAARRRRRRGWATTWGSGMRRRTR